MLFAQQKPFRAIVINDRGGAAANAHFVFKRATAHGIALTQTAISIR